MMLSSTNNHEKQTQQPQHSRAITVAYLLCVICFYCYGCAAQFTEPPGLHGPPGPPGGAAQPPGGDLFGDPPQYQQMTFEPKHRGGYNISRCTNDLFNCWEIMTAVEFCYFVNYKYVATTMCDRMRVYCADDGFEYDDYKYIFEAREIDCDPNGEQKTRRRTGPGAGDRMYIMPWSVPPPGSAQLQALRRRLRGDYTPPPPPPPPPPALASPRPEPERDATRPR